jgi:hypothetical protein
MSVGCVKRTLIAGFEPGCVSLASRLNRCLGKNARRQRRCDAVDERKRKRRVENRSSV